MRMRERLRRSRLEPLMARLMLVALVLVLVERPAAAYLDPGSGSMLLQVLLGGFAAVGVALRLYWHRLTALFGRKQDPHRR